MKKAKIMILVLALLSTSSTFAYFTDNTVGHERFTIGTWFNYNQGFSYDEKGNLFGFNDYGIENIDKYDNLVIPSEIDGVKITKIWGNFGDYNSLNEYPEDPNPLPSEKRFNANKFSSITIEEGILMVTDYAFYGVGVNEVKLADTITSFGPYAFAANNIKEVNIPRDYWSRYPHWMLSGIFMNNLLEKVTFSEGFNSPSLGDKMFSDNPTLVNFVVPESIETFAGHDDNVGPLSNTSVKELRLNTNLDRLNLREMPELEKVTFIGDAALFKHTEYIDSEEWLDVGTTKLFRENIVFEE